ncbi:hypothetical protein CB0940_09394 [Cercospora beticola]|uniref:Uncharacterized protein n=1 Tax=Cercospora beticola TaxID=122368 RepID=A0A2G5HI83_CERBT|nr:hypothetical protein CB0940_09394 [Cercospora beticola]PIA92239.1 hypothetical protein CB0940_09394 [Cercospora beticola]WPB06291.1 hypothetical protein RHO25_010948 [Cercospora beticola]CAK1366180.1 unnamed protein product [Cercospora beticola]
MYSKNVIAVTAALMLGQAAAYPAQLIDRDNQEKNGGPWDITDNSPSCKYDPRLGLVGEYCTGGKQNGVYGNGVRLEDNPAYYTYNYGSTQLGHSDKGFFSKTADGKYTIDWSRNQIAETGEKLDPAIYGYNPYNGIYKRHVAVSVERQSRTRHVERNEVAARAAELNSDNNLAARDDQVGW